MRKHHRSPQQVHRIRHHIALALIIFLSTFTAMANAQAWVNTHTHAHETRNAVFREYLPANEPINVTVVLQLRNEDKLNQWVAAATTRGSRTFGQRLTYAQIQADYAPTQEQAQAVADHLAKSGFSNIEISTNHLLVSATGTSGAARRAFNTELARYERGGRQGIANVTDVQMPSHLANQVVAVLGLQTIDQLHAMNVQSMNGQAMNAQAVTGSVQWINPVNFPAIYNVGSLPAAANTAVGIITEGNMTQTVTDLHTFENNNGLPIINPTIVQVGRASSDTAGTAEWDLDSQNIQAMAGGQVGQMLFYTASSLTDASMTAAFNRAVNDNIAKVINVSLGLCESAAKSDGSMAAGDTIFKLAVAQGQTFVVASGDHGSKECGTAANGTFGTTVGAVYPASSPYVIAVGSTTLSTDSSGNYAGETAWTYSGGSPSLYELQPSWQSGVVQGTYRGIPDIAFDGDPNSGATIIVNGQSQTYGGTSLSAPLFVGVWARLQSSNQNKLGFPGAWIYSYGSAAQAAVFHDVVSGANGDYSATNGWDYTTGFGSFDIAAVSYAIGNKTPLRGDINGDGQITLADLQLLQQYLLGKKSLNMAQQWAADVYPAGQGDGIVAVSDYWLLQKAILNGTQP